MVGPTLSPSNLITFQLNEYNIKYLREFEIGKKKNFKG
ncbi:MAG: hypothetical protein HLUCCX10_01610 [Algoriphagus marincola HL-49]|uniref:Uncharacterized protein n=1 Tax=Algoriphagus marincola HL-49 TaxID=1305737 RepID=A0A0P7XS28_9BACT|nr:MAG: hypothetical protein HLUCCX10_01610 [Algoriphagus marincola HL-49]